jgi:hypothetical protein
MATSCDILEYEAEAIQIILLSNNNQVVFVLESDSLS